MKKTKNKKIKVATKPVVSRGACDHADENGYVAQFVCIKCGKKMRDF